MSNLLEISVDDGKFYHSKKGKLESGCGALLPYQFHYTPLHLKFIIDYAKSKRAFTLEVQ